MVISALAGKQFLERLFAKLDEAVAKPCVGNEYRHRHHVGEAGPALCFDVLVEIGKDVQRLLVKILPWDRPYLRRATAFCRLPS